MEESCPAGRGLLGGVQQRARSLWPEPPFTTTTVRWGHWECPPPLGPFASLSHGVLSSAERSVLAQAAGASIHLPVQGDPLPTGAGPLAPAEAAAKVKISVQRKFIYLFN